MGNIEAGTLRPKNPQIEGQNETSPHSCFFFIEFINYKKLNIDNNLNEFTTRTK